MENAANEQELEFIVDHAIREKGVINSLQTLHINFD